jgi:nicotinate phosphoribosyltransferase
MAFDDELEAFLQYAKALPNNLVFLVDTYDTLKGVSHAIEVGKRLRKEGRELLGIRLDSGDLAYLSAQARNMLDENGFQNTKIIGSNELDEHIIESLKDQGAQITVWGVGTKLITAHDEPALGGVYKLTAIRSKGNPWKYKLKLSEQSNKISNPGLLQIRRYSAGNENVADVIYDLEHNGLSEGCTMIDPLDATRQKHIPKETAFSDLLVPIFRKGKLIYKSPSIHEIKENAKKNLEYFHPGIKRFLNPHKYPVGIEKDLFKLKTDLILKLRGFVHETGIDRS